MLRAMGLGMLACLVLASSVSASTPEDLAARCVQKVQQVVDRATQASQDETEKCLRRIRFLLAQGDYEGAVAVALDCIASAEERTIKAAGLIDELCERCVNALREMGEPRLALRVENFCNEAIEKLRTLLQRQKMVLRNALDNA